MPRSDVRRIGAAACRIRSSGKRLHIQPLRTDAQEEPAPPEVLTSLRYTTEELLGEIVAACLWHSAAVASGARAHYESDDEDDPLETEDAAPAHRLDVRLNEGRLTVLPVRLDPGDGNFPVHPPDRVPAYDGPVPEDHRRLGTLIADAVATRIR
ncbi:hypothetical protein FZ103_09440 [Streptomonospora sp. PA3]|uniref:hypothetical protein n=1 Tax=Streptomonospora sp. PA3 TaxID=2607326 RepID=UPI0012DC4B0D|nr:hypothetical protein [Streptomonospora sp. PA3]MUL41398.1 hypothetical protein [Streptomonospora sp. PA3]